MEKNIKVEEQEEEDVLLTENEVWDVVNFAREFGWDIFPSITSPNSISARLKDITLNPTQPTQSALETALANPKENEKNLREFSQSFEIQSMVYRRLLKYLSNMLSFDITYTATNVKKDTEYNTPRYKEDLEIVERFIDKFDSKHEFRVVVSEMLRNDAYFGVFRDDVGDRYVLQELPSEHCKITGRWEGGFLFDFDMTWFTQPGVDIDAYPAFFKKKYYELYETNRIDRGYRPMMSPELRQSTWSYWVNVPADLGVCFKLTPELATRIPYFTGLFSDLILQPTIRELQKNADMSAASKMIVGEVPYLNRDTKSTVKDSIAISPKLLGKFLSLLQSAISSSIKVATAPLQRIQGISFDAENDIYDSYLRTALATSGINTNLIFSSDIKPNTVETQLSLNVDEQLMTALYTQFNSFMNYFVNRYTKRFKFAFEFEGTDFYVNRQLRLDVVLKLFDKGVVLPQKIAAAIGMRPATFRRHMLQASSDGFMSTLTPPTIEQAKQMQEIEVDTAKQLQEIAPEQKQSPQTPEGDNGEETRSVGRPRKSDSEIDEEGSQTRAEGTNIGRGGKAI